MSDDGWPYSDEDMLILQAELDEWERSTPEGRAAKAKYDRDMWRLRRKMRMSDE